MNKKYIIDGLAEIQLKLKEKNTDMEYKHGFIDCKIACMLSYLSECDGYNPETRPISTDELYRTSEYSAGVNAENKEPETSIPHLLFKWEKEELDFRCGEELTLLREVAKNVDVYFDTPELNNNYPNLFDALYELDEFKKEQSNE